MKAAQSADDEQFSVMWRDFAPRVQIYAMRYVDPHTAQEIVSETFLIAWRRIADLPPDPLPWLLVVARNIIANQRRHAQRSRVVEQELARIAELSLTTAAACGSQDAGEREQMLQALAALSHRDREAVLLVAWDGLSPQQAATVAGCSRSALKVRLHRARKRLSALISPTDMSPADAAPTDVPRRHPMPTPGSPTLATDRSRP